MCNSTDRHESRFEKQDIFAPEERALYRLPSMVVSHAGTILAFANRRRNTVSDPDPLKEVDVALRRSFDGGQTWDPIQDIFSRPGWLSEIGAAIVDDVTGTIMMNYACWPTLDDAKALAQRAGPPEAEWTASTPGKFFAISTDEGETWHHKEAIIAPNRDSVIASTHGCGTGITLRSGAHKGRLVLPALVWTGRRSDKGNTVGEGQWGSCVVYSDDRGMTWQTGGLAGPGRTNEACVVETVEGRLYLNCRTARRDGKRRVAWSYDGGETLTHLGTDDTLIEPSCNAAIVRYSDDVSADRNRILFCNPADPSQRVRMTVRLSYDEGMTWPVSRVIQEEGGSGYSSLAVLADGTILCLYETEDPSPPIRIVVARFNLEWLTEKMAGYCTS